MKRYLDKINANGQYTEFPGITVIANASKNDNAIWKKIHNVLNSNLVSNYFSPLPQNSYHMTVMDLYTEMGDGGDNWGKFVTAHLTAFRRLHSTLEDNKFYPEITLKSIRTSSVIQLQVDIPPEQREIIEKIAAAFNITHKIPKEMHITLAYQYKLVSGSDGEKLKKYLEEEIQRIFAEHPVIVMEAPTLSYFKNMETFVPWNAQKNPFIAKRHHLFQCFSAPDDEAQQSQESRFDLN